MDLEFLVLLLPLLGLGFLTGGGESEAAPIVEGTGDDDEIYGTVGDDTVLSGAGNDFVNTYEGLDEIRLGDGDDTGTGGYDDDVLYGDAGNDVVVGGPENDIIWLGIGDDVSVDYVDQGDLEAGDDEIHGESGNDWLEDFQGSNAFYGGSGNDTLIAQDFPDLADAPDQLFGGTGRDILVGDDGDTVSGGTWLDSFYVHIDSADANPVTITDFDGTLETITLEFYDPSGTQVVDRANLEFATDDTTGDVTLIYSGQIVAQLMKPAVFNLDSVLLEAIV